MEENIIKRLKICLKNENNKLVSFLKDIPKCTTLKELRVKIKKIDFEYEFYDNSEPISFDIEEDMSLEDIEIVGEKIYIQKKLKNNANDYEDNSNLNDKPKNDSSSEKEASLSKDENNNNESINNEESSKNNKENIENK